MNTVAKMARLSRLVRGLGFGVLALLVLSSATRAVAAEKPRLPDLSDCPNLVAPAGNKVAFHVYAQGFQIYRWDGAQWRFIAPEAVLFADEGEHGVVGIHYAGPTWESASGSWVVGSVIERATPDPDSIPWLLLRVVSSGGPGIFRGTTFIQRVETVGGKAPSAPGDFPGAMVRVPYAAEYFFYR